MPSQQRIAKNIINGESIFGLAGFLGQDVEVRVQWDPWPNLSVEAGYDHFFKGSYITRQTTVPGNPPANDTNTFYVQTEVRF